MQLKVIRRVLVILTAFVAITAMGGGLALATGAEGARFPLTWLEGTPFTTYVLPGLLLAILVGGSALIATVMLSRRRESGALSALVSGTLLAGYVTIEAFILKQVPPGPTTIEIFYFVVGAVIVVLAGYLWRTERQRL